MKHFSLSTTNTKTASFTQMNSIEAIRLAAKGSTKQTIKQTAKLLTAFLAVFILSFTTAHAQGIQGKISGQVIDETGNPVESATVALLHAGDSSDAGISISDKKGYYVFDKVSEGQYLAVVSATGRQKMSMPVFTISAKNAVISFKNVILTPKTAELARVSVVGRRPYLEQKADRMVVNVDASPTNTGSNVLDVLEKSPGVTVDKDGNISLKGKQGVTIMIDNRPTYMSGTQLASYLKSLPASAIDQLEIMTNPSSKYDAAGNSGIINLKTKKTKTGGFNGSLTLTHTQGVYPKPNGSINLNYRTGKFNLFFNGGYSRWQGFRELDLTRKYLDVNDKQVTSIFTQTTRGRFTNPSANAKFGMDYYLDKKTTLGFVLSGFQDHNHQDNSSDILLKDPQNNIDSIVASPNTSRNKFKNTSVNLNFRRQFDSTGRELTADMDYVRYSSGNHQYFDNITYDPGMVKKNENILTGDLPSIIDIYSFKTDYSHPIKKDFKLEAGFKTSYVTTDNTAGYFNLIDGVSQVDTTKTNRFLYRENINAVYVNINRQYKKWGIQAGLRLENTHYSGHQVGNAFTAVPNDSSFSRTYTNLFPTLYISYQAGVKNQFAFNYGRRIDRPAYENLNPFLFFLDQYTYQAGNPYLQPQFSDNIEFSHTYNNFLTTTLNYSYTSQFFTETFQQQGHSTIVRNGNLGSRQGGGVAVSAQVPVVKWWTAIIYTNLNYNSFQGMLYGENIHLSAATLLVNINNQLKFNKGWGAELSGFYRTKGVEGQVTIDPMWQASMAVTKQLMKDKANLKLGVRDLFYTNQVTGYINFQQTEASFHNRRDSRELSLSFTWRFGKPLKDSAPRRNHGAGEEQNRVKGGGNN